MWEFLDNIAERIEGKRLFEESFLSDQCCAAAGAFLQRRKIWMHDVLERYRRKPGRECSASDDDIVPPPGAEFTRFRTLLDSVSIAKFAFTSERAAEWTFLALKNEGLLTSSANYTNAFLRWRSIDRLLPIEEFLERKYMEPFMCCVIDRDVSFFILPSPSARAPVRGLTLQRKQAIYEYVLFGCHSQTESPPVHPIE
jgi:hypothetical protein